MSSSIVSPFPVFNDLDGTPLEAGYIYIGTANLNAEAAPVNVFWDAALTIPAAQPLRTVGGYPSRQGSPSAIYVAADTYSMVVRNRNQVFVFSSASTGNPIFTGYPVTRDQLSLPLLGTDSSFIQAGTSAVTRVMQDKVRERVSVKDFGAVGDGTTDDTAAIQAALNAGIAANKAVYFPGGTYKVTYLVQITLPNSAQGSQATNYFAQLVAYGDGFSNTIINCTNTGWLKIIGSSQQHSVDIADMTVAYGSTGVSTAIEMNCSSYPFFGEFTAKSRIRVHFRGNDGINHVNYWGTCVDAIDWSNIDFSGSMFDGASTPNGTGVVTRKSAGNYVCVFNFTNCHFRFLSVGYNYGTGSQTANFDSCFFAMCITQIYGPSGVNHQGLSVNNCESYELGTGDGIYLTCAVPNFVFTNNRWSVSAGYRGVALDVADMFTICNNQFFPDTTPNTATAAIDINGTISGSNGIIDGNNFAGTTVGARLKSTSANVRFGGGNKWTVGMTGVTNSGTNNVIGELVASPLGTIGYSAGAGGTVTQATNKSTAVTLNTPTGQITTSNASLASNTEISFTVNNSVMTVDDIVFAAVDNGNYQVRVTDSGSGTFVIRLKNISGSSLSDAVLVKYAIINSVTT
jgi:hypothetical protein